MRFKIPGKDVTVRLFERVETVDNQYDIFDVGLQQEDGGAPLAARALPVGATTGESAGGGRDPHGPSLHPASSPGLTCSPLPLPLSPLLGLSGAELLPPWP